MENDYPSLPEQGKNLAKFTFEVLKKALANGGASLLVSEKIQRERLEICKQCPKYDDLQHRCKECGCPLGAKVKFALDSCPLSKWSESDVDWVSEEYEHIIQHLDEETPKNMTEEPVFPEPDKHDLKVGDRYEWNLKTWIWNGSEWVRLTDS
jgi:hypothetical protein